MAQEQFNKVRTTITVDKEIYNAVLKAAQEDDRTFSYVVNKILADWLKEKGN